MAGDLHVENTMLKKSSVQDKVKCVFIRLQLRKLCGLLAVLTQRKEFKKKKCLPISEIRKEERVGPGREGEKWGLDYSSCLFLAFGDLKAQSIGMISY